MATSTNSPPFIGDEEDFLVDHEAAGDLLVAAPPSRVSTTTTSSSTTQEHHEHHGSSSFKSLLAGAVGGTLEVLTDHPIDLVKVRLQTASATVGDTAAAVAAPRTVPSVIQQVVSEGGWMGLYRGASIRIATLMPGTALGFWGLDVGKQLILQLRYNQNHVHHHHHHFSAPEVTAAGAFSGIPVTLFATPSERIKCLLQTAASSSAESSSYGRRRKYYKGPVDCAMQICRSGGLVSLYRGFGITLARNIPGYASWFGSYEVFKGQLLRLQGTDPVQHHSSSSPSWLTILLAGGLSGSLSWAVMIPFDGIKSLIQTSPQSLTIREAYRQLTYHQGWRALFRGMGPAVLIAFPANAACFVGMELGWMALSLMEGKLISTKATAH